MLSILADVLVLFSSVFIILTCVLIYFRLQKQKKAKQNQDVSKAYNKNIKKGK